MNEYAGKKAVVTGGTQGMGLAMAQALRGGGLDRSATRDGVVDIHHRASRGGRTAAHPKAGRRERPSQGHGFVNVPAT
jgi:NAD(P)-dependent dehydrogenase (short-subunit alcohol dehydrogenase family)